MPSSPACEDCVHRRAKKEATSAGPLGLLQGSSSFSGHMVKCVLRKLHKRFLCTCDLDQHANSVYKGLKQSGDDRIENGGACLGRSKVTVARFI